MKFNDATSLMADLLQISSETLLSHHLMKLTSALGFEKYALRAEINRPFFGQIQHVISNYSLEWQRTYHDRNFIAIDPILAHCRLHSDAIMWSDGFGGEASFEFWSQARLHKMAHGLSIPVHGRTGLFSMVSLVREAPLAADTIETMNILNQVRVLAYCTHNVVLRMLSSRLLAQNDPKLSPREKECMRWVAHGKTASEIADTLCLAEATVAFHVNKAIRKLGAQNRSQAIAFSVALGLMD